MSPVLLSSSSAQLSSAQPFCRPTQPSPAQPSPDMEKRDHVNLRRGCRRYQPTQVSAVVVLMGCGYTRSPLPTHTCLSPKCGRGGAQPTNQPRVTMPSITRVSSSTEKPHSRDSDGRAKLRISERCAVPGL
ncbi:hypothetical protein BHE74_00054265 [Ensete ventricosum]|nr:hypothetical protein BHE74_00054265 [Ensete ventricosum]